MNMTTRRVFALMGGILILACSSADAMAAGTGDYQKYKKQARAERKQTVKRLVEERSPAIVTIRFISKEIIMGQEQKNEMEAPGVMVSPDGMVLAPNSRLQGLISMAMAQAGSMIGGMMGSLPPIQSDTEDLRVIIGNETDELEAKLIARDSDLDLAWVRIVDTKGRTFEYVDFNDSVRLAVGDDYYTISRMAERFDRVPLVNTATVIAKVENPRPLWVGSMPYGGVVFKDDAKVAGFIITQPPEEGEESAMSLDLASMALSNNFILPAPEVVKAFEQAKKLAKEQAEKQAQEEAEKQAEEPAKEQAEKEEEKESEAE